MISWSRATQALRRELPVRPAGSLATSDCSGRVLADAVLLPGPRPAVPLSAMDGFAVRARDRGKRVCVVGSSRPGDGRADKLHEGQCVRVATGAPLPLGADVVVPRELAQEVAESRVMLPSDLVVGKHVVRVGSDVRRSARLPRGLKLTAPAIAALLELGTDKVSVFCPPHVHVVPIGDELVDSTRVESNGPVVAALLASAGAHVTVSKPIADDVIALEEALASPADVHVTIGGTSVGERDVAAQLAKGSGAIRFQGVAVRPGRPVFLSSLGGVPWLGLPGNPAAAVLLTRAMLAPAIRRAQGLPKESDSSTVTRRVGARIHADADRTTLQPILLRDGRAEPVRPGNHGATFWFAKTQGLVVVPPGEGILRGHSAEVMLW